KINSTQFKYNIANRNQNNISDKIEKIQRIISKKYEDNEDSEKNDPGQGQENFPDKVDVNSSISNYTSKNLVSREELDQSSNYIADKLN
ncbi:MAG: hypothetical protein MHPSP_004053, partial [Paramarteilia canceri]